LHASIDGSVHFTVGLFTGACRCKKQSCLTKTTVQNSTFSWFNERFNREPLGLLYSSATAT